MSRDRIFFIAYGTGVFSGFVVGFLLAWQLFR